MTDLILGSLLLALAIGGLSPATPAFCQSNDGSAPSEFNTDPLDKPLVRLMDVNKGGNWDVTVDAAPGDTIGFDVYYHNCVEESIALNTMVKITFPDEGLNEIVITGHLQADNAPEATGDATINISAPQQLLFDTTCWWYPDQGSTPIVLTATVNNGSVEVGIGNIQGGWKHQGHVVFRAKAISASPGQQSLTISSTAGGSVTSPGEGTFTYLAGTVVNLVATADSGYNFVNWTGETDTVADVNSASTTITVLGNCSITANFVEKPPPEPEVFAESYHPYADNCENTWTISELGVAEMRIHFVRIELERNDYVQILDADNKVLKTYGVYYNAVNLTDEWSEWYSGETLKVKLRTDGSGTAYGFLVDEKETRGTSPTPPEPEAIIESRHPYANNYEDNWTISEPGVAEIRIHFYKLELKDYGDTLTMRGKEDNFLKGWEDTLKEDYWTEWYTGNTLKLELKTDRSGTAYGFLVDKVETRGTVPPPLPEPEAIIESCHPYANNCNKTWEIYNPDEEQVRIHFYKLELGDYGDTLTLRDKDDNFLKEWRNTLEEDYWTEWFNTTGLKLRLKTDSSGTAYGFLIDKIEIRGEETANSTIVTLPPPEPTPIPGKLYVNLLAQVTNVSVGETIILLLSCVNPVTSNGTLVAELTLDLPSGWSLIGAYPTPPSGGLQTAVYKTNQGETKTVKATILANEPFDGLVRGYVDYYYINNPDLKYRIDVSQHLTAVSPPSSESTSSYKHTASSGDNGSEPSKVNRSAEPEAANEPNVKKIIIGIIIGLVLLIGMALLIKHHRSEEGYY